MSKRFKCKINKLNKAISKLENKRDISDGSHTFNELYYHRALLFAQVINNYPEISFKAYKHFDESIWEGYFITGILTPEGYFTYHYPNELWDKFKVTILENAPEWDGHTSEDITRLASLPLVGE